MEWVINKVFSRLVPDGTLYIELPNGRTLTYGDGTGAPVRIAFRDRSAIFGFLSDPDLRLGELFMDEGLVVKEGTIFDFLCLVLRNSAGKPDQWWVRTLDRYRYATRRFLQRNVARKSRQNVHHHYDLDDRLYDLFLDQDRQYSCAYFETGNETLEDAQLAKKRHIAAKLCFVPGQSILDIGCGWGGMGLYLARVAGAGNVRGITLSDEQLAVAKRRASEKGLDDRVVFALEDYRNTQGTFDRIVSVGMFEHVGVDYYDAFFQQASKLLKDDGVMLLHTIGNSDVPSFTSPWITKYIFPGGHIPSMSEILPAIERAGLIVTDIEVLRLHYAKTLHQWRDRFMARRDEAVKLYDERFCRMWEFYLSASETAFLYQDIAIFQFQIARRQENVPLTRDYIGPAEAALKAAEGHYEP